MVLAGLQSRRGLDKDHERNFPNHKAISSVSWQGLRPTPATLPRCDWFSSSLAALLLGGSDARCHS